MKTKIPFIKLGSWCSMLIFHLIWLGICKAADVDVFTYDPDDLTVVKTTFFLGERGVAKATITCTNPVSDAQYLWSDDVLPENSATVNLRTDRLGANKASVVVTGTIAGSPDFNGSGSALFTVIDGPKCDNPHTISADFFECDHNFGAVDLDPCFTDAVIKNMINGVVCDFHPLRTGTQHCDVNTFTLNPLWIQTVVAAPCEGGVVFFQDFLPIFQGCSTCEGYPIRITCETTDPGNAPIIRVGEPRGIMGQINNCP